MVVGACLGSPSVDQRSKAPEPTVRVLGVPACARISARRGPTQQRGEVGNSPRSPEPEGSLTMSRSEFLEIGGGIPRWLSAHQAPLDNDDVLHTRCSPLLHPPSLPARLHQQGPYSTPASPLSRRGMPDGALPAKRMARGLRGSLCGHGDCDEPLQQLLRQQLQKHKHAGGCCLVALWPGD